MKKSSFLAVLALILFFRATLAHADLVPPGGEGVNACRDKKAGDSCQNYVIGESEQRLEPGTCVEEKLDHLRFKFKAHLRCVSASVPAGSASAAKPPPSAAVTTSATASAAPVVPSTSPIVSAAPPAPPATSAATETPKSGGCSLVADPSNALAFGFFMLGVGVLWRARRHPR